MGRILRGWAAIIAIGLLVACGRAPSPLEPEGNLREDPVFAHLESRQRQWCERITGKSCWVMVSEGHPEFAAWVDWSRSTPMVFWNERVLSDRQFWITDPRMAHEACHLKHGWQPDWTLDEMERFADQCAVQYAGTAP